MSVDDIPFPENWVAEQLLAAPDGVLTRSALRDAAPPIPGSVASRSKWEKGGSGTNGSRSSRYVYNGVRILEQEGLAVRSGEYVVIADRPGLVAWLAEGADMTTGQDMDKERTR